MKSRIEIIRRMLAGNERLLEFLFGSKFADVTDDRGDMDVDRIVEHIGVLSSGEQILCRVAMDIWGDYGHVRVGDICRRLDHDNFNRAIKAIIQFRDL